MLTVDKGEKIPPNDVTIPDRLRRMDEQRVLDLMESFTTMGQMTPIQLRIIGDGEDVILVAGRHRLEAARRLEWPYINMNFVYGTEDEFRLWEIAENLHRSELDTLERSEHIAEWIRLTEKEKKPIDADKAVLGQVAPKLSARGRKGEGRPKSGAREAIRKLGIEHRDARRAIKIDAISPEAKQAAREAGLRKNQSALLKVAAAPKEEQVTVVERIRVEKAERAEAKQEPEHSPAAEAEPSLGIVAAFTDYVTAHIAEDDLPGLLGFMERMTAGEMAAVIREIMA
jgi:ParB-like chromosome segregation protein Spo0J